jgi:hypothetical protein
MWAWSAEHQSEFAQGFNDSCLDLIREGGDQFLLRPPLPGFEFAAKESDEIRTRAGVAGQTFMRNLRYVNVTQRCRCVFRYVCSQCAPEHATRSDHIGGQLHSSFRDMRQFDNSLKQPKQARQSIALPVNDRTIGKIQGNELG